MLKLVDKIHTPLSLAISRRSSLFKSEDTNYVSAFLTSVRQKLLPFHSKSLKNYPSKSELEKIYSEIYKEVNELYIDEHDTIGNNDYLEQTYDIFSNIHKLVRKYEIVYDIKLEENRKKFLKNDPNDFPVYNLTGSDSEPDYKTIWELKEDFTEEFEELHGYFLKLKNSKIEHPDSGKGVFLSCKERKFVLPGTLLGFYPGVIFFNYMEAPKTQLKTVYEYLKRFDGTWLDANRKIPYPYKFGLSLQEFQHQDADACAVLGIKDLLYKTIPISFLNPLALGHKLNHPPPDISANVKLIDIIIPFNFLPSEFLRYLPNIFEADFIKKSKFHAKAFRTVGLISLNDIKHNEELYVDYIDEDMVPSSYRPDWLIQPPPRNPYLIKNEYVMKPNTIDRLVNKIYQITYEKENLEFNKYIKRDEGLDLNRANYNIKKLQNEIRSLELKGISDNKYLQKKLISNENEKK